jgi:hypothetical protein
MDTQIIGRARTRGAAGPAGIAAYLGMAALVIAAAWYGLAAKGVTVTPAPQPPPGATPQAWLHIYYRWLVTTLPQERLYTSIAIAGFICLAVVAVYARDLLGRDHGLARAGAFALWSGVVLWITGSITQLGGHRAVGLMATHTNPIQTTNSIAFTIDMIGQAFALAAFALIGAGMMAFASAAARARTRRRAWSAYTALVSLLLLITAWSYAVGNGSLTDLMLLAGGLVVLPVWLAWTAALTRADHQAAGGSTAPGAPAGQCS